MSALGDDVALCNIRILHLHASIFALSMGSNVAKHYRTPPKFPAALPTKATSGGRVARPLTLPARNNIVGAPFFAFVAKGGHDADEIKRFPLAGSRGTQRERYGRGERI